MSRLNVISINSCNFAEMDRSYLNGPLIKLNEIDSTNNYALEMLKNGMPAEGTTIISQLQTAGKGQRGNSWFSESGKNITASLILYPQLPIKNIFTLNMAISIALVEALREISNSNFQIKWPNDILYNKSKICGILIENQLKGTFVQSSVIGFGINVNQEKFEKNMIATSLKSITGKEFIPEDLIEIILNRLDYFISLLKVGKFQQISKKYHSMLYGMNQKNFLEFENKIEEGVIIGVNEDGKLIVEFALEKKFFLMKEVKMLL